MNATPSASHTHPEGVGALVGQVQSELTRVMVAAFARADIALNYNQVRVLRRLRALGEMSPGELARGLSYDSGGMTRLLDQLEHKALLQRQPHASDRRALRIVLTPAGRALGDTLVALSEEVLADALADLSQSERRRLSDYMQRILQTLRGSC